MRLELRTALVVLTFLFTAELRGEAVRLGVFEMDASPPIGSPLAYDPNTEVQTPLTCKGIVLQGAGSPIVICSLDWIGIGNASHGMFRQVLAQACGTSLDRVCVHTIHQHDAPWCDAAMDAILWEHQIPGGPFDSPFARQVMDRAGVAAAEAMRAAVEVTHVGESLAEVEKVASSRRILGPDGKVLHVRWTATTDPAVRAFPEGVIDPQLRMIRFWHAERPLVALTYYATHPQSYYRTGKANSDFPGMARDARQVATGVPHIHFNGAGGNISAGKYNDGAPDNRKVLADRLEDAMRRAWEQDQRTPLDPQAVTWKSVSVALPPAPHLSVDDCHAALGNPEFTMTQKLAAAGKLAWLNRCRNHERIDVGCLTLGNVRMLHMPGELFVEYQLEAQRLVPDQFVAMAAYGDYGPAYIGTRVSYEQGGYETGPDASFVAPEVETPLMAAIAELLGVDESHLRPLQ